MQPKTYAYPRLVGQLVTLYDAWIVGGAANPQADNVRDFDVMVPYRNWPKASLIIPKNATVNTFGGWKCESDGKVVDVWPDDLDTILNSNLNIYAWHPRSGTRIMRLPYES